MDTSFGLGFEEFAENNFIKFVGPRQIPTNGNGQE